MSVELFSENIGLCCCFLFPLTEVKSSSSIFVSGEAECWIAVGCEGWGRTALPAYSPSHEMWYLCIYYHATTPQSHGGMFLSESCCKLVERVSKQCLVSSYILCLICMHLLCYIGLTNQCTWLEFNLRVCLGKSTDIPVE